MGRPSKGPRRQLAMISTPRPLADMIFEAAGEHGYQTVNDYMLTVVAAAHSFPVKIQRIATAGQTVLPIKRGEIAAARTSLQAGETVQLTTRAPVELADLVKSAVLAEGYASTSDYLLSIFGARHGYAVAVKKKKTPARQEELPLQTAS